MSQDFLDINLEGYIFLPGFSLVFYPFPIYEIWFHFILELKIFNYASIILCLVFLKEFVNYWMSKKSFPFFIATCYKKNGRDFLDLQYNHMYYFQRSNFVSNMFNNNQMYNLI